MEVILRKYGNSTVAVLPPAVLRELGLAAGQSMTLDTTPEGTITLSPRKRRYTLAELLAQCSPSAGLSTEDRGLLDVKPVGRELL